MRRGARTSGACKGYRTSERLAEHSSPRQIRHSGVHARELFVLRASTDDRPAQHAQRPAGGMPFSAFHAIARTYFSVFSHQGPGPQALSTATPLGPRARGTPEPVQLASARARRDGQPRHDNAPHTLYCFQSNACTFDICVRSRGASAARRSRQSSWPFLSTSSQSMRNGNGVSRN